MFKIKVSPWRHKIIKHIKNLTCFKQKYIPNCGLFDLCAAGLGDIKLSCLEEKPTCTIF